MIAWRSITRRSPAWAKGCKSMGLSLLHLLLLPSSSLHVLYISFLIGIFLYELATNLCFFSVFLRCRLHRPAWNHHYGSTLQYPSLFSVTQTVWLHIWLRSQIRNMQASTSWDNMNSSPCTTLTLFGRRGRSRLAYMIYALVENHLLPINFHEAPSHFLG